MRTKIKEYLIAKDIIAFTDSDCIPAKDWIEKGVRNLLNIPNCGLVAGRDFFKNPSKPNAIELYALQISNKKDIERRRFWFYCKCFYIQKSF